MPYQRLLRFLSPLLLALLLSACAGVSYLSDETRRSGPLSDATILRHASAGP